MMYFTGLAGTFVMLCFSGTAMLSLMLTFNNHEKDEWSRACAVALIAIWSMLGAFFFRGLMV
jgi:hypothetical protein